MSNFMLSFNAVMPLFLLIALGYFLKRVHLLDEQTLGKMNALVFKAFIPVMLFKNIYQTNVETALNGRMLLYAIASVLVMLLLLILIVPRLVKDNARRAVLIQAMYRSNVILLGLPVVTELCGVENTGLVALMSAVIIPLFNITSVVIFEVYRGGRINLRSILLNIAKNPLIIASALGLLALLIGLKLPYALQKPVEEIAALTTPLALVVLGGFFEFSAVRENVRAVVAGLLVKLIAAPLVFLGIAVLLGFRGVALVTLMTLYCAPASVTSFSMAKQLDGDAALAAQFVVVGTAASALTIFLWIFILKELALF